MVGNSVFVAGAILGAIALVFVLSWRADRKKQQPDNINHGQSDKYLGIARLEQWFKRGVAATFVLLLALKLTGLISWSWWWVTAPLWLAGLLGLLILVGSVTFIGLFVVLPDKWRTRGRP